MADAFATTTRSDEDPGYNAVLCSRHLATGLISLVAMTGQPVRCRQKAAVSLPRALQVFCSVTPFGCIPMNTSSVGRRADGRAGTPRNRSSTSKWTSYLLKQVGSYCGIREILLFPLSRLVHHLPLLDSPAITPQRCKPHYSAFFSLSLASEIRNPWPEPW